MTATTAIVALASGCEDRLCRDVGIDSSGRYQATLVALYDAQGSFVYDRSLIILEGLPGSCAQRDGIGPGVVLELQARGTVDNRNKNCKLIVADLVAPPLQISESTDAPQANAIVARNQIADISLMYVAAGVEVGGCSGGLGLSIRPGVPAGLFATPVSGQLPPALLYRIFVPSSNACTACEDNFVIHFAKD